MKKVFVALLALASALAITPAALADSFNFTFVDGGITANGTLVASEIGNTGVYDVTSGTINVNFGNEVMTGVLDPNPNAPAPLSPVCPNCGKIDDLLYPSSNSPQILGSSENMLLDSDGLLFTVNGTFGNTNIWSGDNNGNGTSYSINSTWDCYGGGKFEISQTPEPSSLLLLGTGLLGLAFVAFRKAKSSSLVLHV